MKDDANWRSESTPGDILEQLHGVSTGTACVEPRKLGVTRTFMKGIHPVLPLGPDRRAAGRAVTIRFLPLREDVVEAMPEGEWVSQRQVPIRKAFELLEPNDVLVIDAMGYPEGAVIGDVISTGIKQRGAAAVVIDGVTRDSGYLRQLGLPFFARGLHADVVSNFLITLGDVNVLIQCGGVLVLPGDVIHADDDGVLVIPRTLAAKTAALGKEREVFEIFQRTKILQGVSTWDAYSLVGPLRQEFEEYRATLH